MKKIIHLTICALSCNVCLAANTNIMPNNGSTSETLITTKTALSDRLMFTCDIKGTNLDPFIFNTTTNKLFHPEIFNEANKTKINTKFSLKNITDEYMFLERTYDGKKHRTVGAVKEQIYILRYASKIGNQYAVKVKSKTFVNDEEFSGNDGRCDVVQRLF